MKIWTPKKVTWVNKNHRELNDFEDSQIFFRGEDALNNFSLSFQRCHYTMMVP